MLHILFENYSKLGPNVPQTTSFSFTAKFRGHLRQGQQVKLVNKIDDDPTAKKIDTYTKGQEFLYTTGKRQ